MAFLGFTQLRLLNSVAFAVSGIWQWGYWLVYGTPETPELQLVRQQSEQIQRMESDLKQLWALSTKLAQPQPLEESIEMIPDGES